MEVTTYREIMLQIHVLQQYDSQWYVGKIIEFDDEDREYHISFMVVLGNHSEGPKRSTGGGILTRQSR